MKVKKVLKSNNLPTRLPVTQTLLTGLALDYWNAPQWIWGALGLFFLLGWAAAIFSMVTEEKVDLLKNDD